MSEAAAQGAEEEEVKVKQLTKKEIQSRLRKQQRLDAEEYAEIMLPENVTECDALELLDAFVMSGKNNISFSSLHVHI